MMKILGECEAKQKEEEENEVEVEEKKTKMKMKMEMKMENKKRSRVFIFTKFVLIGSGTAVKIVRALGSTAHLQTNFVVSPFGSMFMFVVVITFVFFTLPIRDHKYFR